MPCPVLSFLFSLDLPGEQEWCPKDMNKVLIVYQHPFALLLLWEPKGDNQKKTEEKMLRKGKQKMMGDVGFFLVKCEILLYFGFMFFKN